MASRIFLVLLLLAVSCSCLEVGEDKLDKDILVVESRGKKKKVALRLIGTLFAVLMAKIAVSKVFGGFFLWMFMQKLFAIAGWFLNSTMMTRTMPAPPPPAPAPAQTPVTDLGPNDYNTLGYSYGPPDSYSPPEPSPPEPASYGVPDFPYNRRKLIN